MVLAGITVIVSLIRLPARRAGGAMVAGMLVLKRWQLRWDATG
jgi:hypothetical protein